MPIHFFAPRYPTPRQSEIWLLHRENYLGKEIAKNKGITRARVSQILKEANQRVEELLESTARRNKIRLQVLSPEHGYARGESVIFKVKTYITYSPVNGIQVWYDHEGPCEACEEFGQCRQAILQEFKERKLQIPNEKIRPTELGEILFNKLEEMLK